MNFYDSYWNRRSILYFHIETLKQRLDAFNQLRFERAISVMSPICRNIYARLALFFHYNHPSLPGFIDYTTPHGICFYTPNEEDKRYLKDTITSPLVSPNARELPITGIYSMGSTSSIGQNASSDLDIWICHQSWLTDEERTNITKKCKEITFWAKKNGVELNFFLIDENRFRSHERSCLSSDDCGSTQHILLLDEFYRSAVRLAGRRLLWNMISTEDDSHYEESVLSLYVRGALINDEWLDLGRLNRLSAEEYFGASLWQLYKSIDSPYKSVLKVLLLEAYAWQYPNTTFISEQIRHCIQEGDIISFGLDHYCMMFDRVSHYLESIKDNSRLEVVRRCFFLKIVDVDCEDLPWRQKIIEHYVNDWQWDEHYLSFLQNRKQWKIEQVSAAHDELLAVLMQSYRNLICFARTNHVATSASPQDITILTRKLYVAFENLPGKVLLVNPQISPDLSERYLSFIYVNKESINQPGWHLYNRAPVIHEIVGQKPLESHCYLSKLVAWCYFNGLLTHHTHLFIKGGGVCNEQKLKEFITDISDYFPMRIPSAKPQALYDSCKIKMLAIVINL